MATSGIRATCCSAVTKNKRRSLHLKERDQVNLIQNEHGFDIRNKNQNPKVRRQNLCPVERDDARHASLEDRSKRKACFNDNRGVKFDRRNCTLHHPYAFGRKHQFQYGQGDNHIQTVGEAPSHLWKAILLIETHTDLKVVQYEDERDWSGDLPHQHLQ